MSFQTCMFFLHGSQMEIFKRNLKSHFHIFKLAMKISHIVSHQWLTALNSLVEWKERCSSKCPLLCFTGENKSNRFGAAWGWIHYLRNYMQKLVSEIVNVNFINDIWRWEVHTPPLWARSTSAVKSSTLPSVSGYWKSTPLTSFPLKSISWGSLRTVFTPM